jgi:hypothetical protein
MFASQYALATPQAFPALAQHPEDIQDSESEAAARVSMPPLAMASVACYSSIAADGSATSVAASCIDPLSDVSATERSPHLGMASATPLHASATNGQVAFGAKLQQTFFQGFRDEQPVFMLDPAPVVVSRESGLMHLTDGSLVRVCAEGLAHRFVLYPPASASIQTAGIPHEVLTAAKRHKITED